DIVLKTELGLKIEPVHYRGASQAITDVMGGIIDYTIESSSTAVGTSSSGKAKPLVIMSSERVSVLPEVPSAAESSHPNLRYSIWNMMLVPKGVPQHVLDKLNAAVNHVLQRPDVRKRYAEMGLSVPSEESRSLEGASTLLKSEVAKWNELLKKAGVPPKSSR
ncbi:MAG: Bug family tripartite tricarboxylate transporter substrate binding protein, partial [Advenella sp.]